MATFSQWLAKQEDAPQDSPVGWLARAWKSQEGNRPRVSSPSGIEKHMLTLAAGDDAQQDSWRSYVHTAVNEATTAYKADKVHEQSGSSTSSTQTQETLPGTNPATGKPVAVVPGNQWTQHPNAVDYGSCHECGWPRGLADLGAGAGEQLTCAAGHVFEPQKPGAPEAGETVITLSGPLTPTVGDGGAGLTREQVNEAESFKDDMQPVDLPADGQPDAQGWMDAGDVQPVDMLGLVNLKLTVVLISLGLPTDPDAMMGMIVSAAEQQEAGSLSEQLADGLYAAGVNEHPDTGKGGWRAGADVNGQLPPDFAAWYGIADPEATEQ